MHGHADYLQRSGADFLSGTIGIHVTRGSLARTIEMLSSMNPTLCWIDTMH